jgi:hypothetical protein
LNLRPSGYEPDELPTAPLRDISIRFELLPLCSRTPLRDITYVFWGRKNSTLWDKIILLTLNIKNQEGISKPQILNLVLTLCSPLRFLPDRHGLKPHLIPCNSTLQKGLILKNTP